MPSSKADTSLSDPLAPLFHMQTSFWALPWLAGSWGTICSQQFDNVTAVIACRQVTNSLNAVGHTYGLNGTFTATQTWPRFAPALTTVKFWLDGLFFRGNCLGNESRLIDCVPPQAWGAVSSTCNTQSLGVGILCWPTPTIKADEDRLYPVSQEPYTCTTSGAYRLVNGPAFGIGRVEVRNRCLGLRHGVGKRRWCWRRGRGCRWQWDLRAAYTGTPHQLYACALCA